MYLVCCVTSFLVECTSFQLSLIMKSTTVILVKISVANLEKILSENLDLCKLLGISFYFFFMTGR